MNWCTEKDHIADDPPYPGIESIGFRLAVSTAASAVAPKRKILNDRLPVQNGKLTFLMVAAFSQAGHGGTRAYAQQRRQFERSYNYHQIHGTAMFQESTAKKFQA
jgi:hypothetical protein